MRTKLYITAYILIILGIAAALYAGNKRDDKISITHIEGHLRYIPKTLFKKGYLQFYNGSEWMTIDKKLEIDPNSVIKW